MIDSANIVKELCTYDSVINDLYQQLKLAQNAWAFPINSVLIKIKALCRPETEELLKKFPPELLFRYEGPKTYTILNNRISPEERDRIVEVVTDLHLVLSEYRRLVNDPHSYIEELRQQEIYHVKKKINRAMNKHQCNKETIRQMLEVVTDPVAKYDFSFIIDNYDRQMITDHWSAVQELGLETFFRDFDENEASAPELGQLRDKVDPKYEQSFGYMCHKMKQIAMTSWDQFVQGYITTYIETIGAIQPHIEQLHL